MRVLLLTFALAAALAGCAFYSPTITDCSVRCDDAGACPAGLSCANGVCQSPSAPTRCECRPGEQASCGGGKGECTPGVKTCNSTGTWSDTCVGEGRPSKELCDGKDNDCNGQVDDFATDLRPCAVDAGVCSTVFQRCVDGGQVACTVADYPSTYEPVELSCDGLDNDCDGLVDITPVVTLVPEAQAWGFYTVDAGYAAVFVRTGTAADGGDELVVARFDAVLAPVGQPVPLRDAPYDWAVGAYGPDLFLAWTQDSAIEAVRLDAQGVAHPFARLEDAGYSSWLKLGVSDRLVVTYFADGSTIARAARWSLDGGFASTLDLNHAAGTAPTLGLNVVNVSRKGRYGLFNADNPDGGDPVSEVIDLDTRSLAINDAYYYGGEGTELLDLADGGLSTAYLYTFTDPTTSWSGLYIHPNLLDDTLQEITVADDTSDVNHYGACDATLSENDELDFVYQDLTAQNLMFAHMDGGARRMQANQKAVPMSVVGGGVPMLAQPARGQLLGLALHGSGTLTGLRICGAK